MSKIGGFKPRGRLCYNPFQTLRCGTKSMLITNGRIITWTQPNIVLEGRALLISDGMISEIGLNAALRAKYTSEEVLDAKGQLIMPGNICAHTHFYGAFSRGLGIPGDAPANFVEILEKLWWKLDKALTLDDVGFSAQVCLVDAIKHGTTTLFDHHASPNAVEGSLNIIAEKVEEAGVRASLCYEVTDRDGPERALAGIKENRDFIEYTKKMKPGGGRIKATFGLHASLTLSDKTLELSRESNPQGGFHIHAAEANYDQYDSLKKSGSRVIDRLEKFGILGPGSIVAHAVHVDAKEIGILAETKTWMSHQPRSNMNNAVGIGPVESQIRAGVKVCLGNDGFSNAMWAEWKTAYLVHKLWHLDPRRMNGNQVVEMAVYNNAELASLAFKKSIGVIQPGAAADLIFVDYLPFTPMNEGNLPWHILFGFHESMITTTIVDGKVLMRDRALLTLDEEKITREAMVVAPKIWERFNQ